MKGWILVVVGVVILGALVGWRLQVKAAAGAQLKKAAALRKQASSNVVTVAALSGDILEHVDVVGTVTTPFDVRLGAKVAGTVEYLQVRPGDTVTAGETLVTIDPSQLQAQVAQMRSNVAEAQQRYTQALVAENPANVQVQTQIGQQKASVASAVANQNQTTVNYAAQVAAAAAAVADANSKVASATAQQGAAQQSVLSAQANFNDAQVKYNRTYQLYQQGYISAQQVDDAHAARDVAQAAVQSAQQTVSASGSAVQSARAQLDAANQQLSITKQKGKADIVAAQAQTRSAQESLKYASSNRAQVPAYKANLAALQAAVAAAQAQLNNALAQLSQTSLKSPFNGTVTSRTIDPGSVATTGQPLLEVQFLDWLFVNASAPIEQSSKIKVGQSATLTFDALPGQTFTATISNVTPAADPSSRQFNFQMKLPNPQHMFKPGMFAHIDIVTDRIHADVMVPHEAVTAGDNGTSLVTVVDSGDVAHVVPVKVGATDPVNTQILSGVNAGDQVVTLSYQPVKEGTKVHPNGKGMGAGAGGGGGGVLGGGAPGGGGGGRGRGRRGAAAGAGMGAGG